jgi:hypothetical protein
VDIIAGAPLSGCLEKVNLSNVCASLPKAGAECGSSVRWYLCGGRRVTGVPTPIKPYINATGVKIHRETLTHSLSQDIVFPHPCPIQSVDQTYLP